MFTLTGKAKEVNLAAMATTNPSDVAKFQIGMLIHHWELPVTKDSY